MKTYLLIFTSLFYTVSIYSQAVCYRDFQDNTNTYAARDTFVEIMVADDFGPRDPGDDWHGDIINPLLKKISYNKKQSLMKNDKKQVASKIICI